LLLATQNSGNVSNGAAAGITSIRAIERELARLRGEVAAEDGPNLRTSVMTHVAWVPERWIDAATETLAGLGERHPSRTILLFPDPRADRDALEAEVDLRCFVRGGGKSVCSEVIAIHLYGRRASAPASIVLPLTISDLPVFLRWRGEVHVGSPELEQLVGEVDRLVVDSREWTSCERTLARLPRLFDRVAVSDITWTRIEPWREALANLWPDVADVSTLRVVGPRADAVLLTLWLGSRLGREVDLDHELAEAMEAVEADELAARPTRSQDLSPSDLLSEQLDVFGRDPIYEEAVRSFSSVPT
jgi:glucose-6-phosphate dehydrogenase assembly protein OpcA